MRLDILGCPQTSLQLFFLGTGNTASAAFLEVECTARGFLVWHWFGVGFFFFFLALCVCNSAVFCICLMFVNIDDCFPKRQSNLCLGCFGYRDLTLVYFKMQYCSASPAVIYLGL